MRHTAAALSTVSGANRVGSGASGDGAPSEMSSRSDSVRLAASEATATTQ
jgi:hypothetical protein